MSHWRIGQKEQSVASRDLFILPTLLSLPIILSLVWGVYFADNAYVSLHYAQNLAAGKGLTGFVGDVPPLPSPLWTAVLTFAALLHLPLTYTALVLSALGWGVTAVLLYQTTQKWHAYPLLALLPALLLVLNPIVIHTSGTEIAWLLAAALLTWRTTAVLPLLPLIAFDWPTGILILILLGAHHYQTRRVSPSTPINIRDIKPIGSLALLILTTVGWAAISWWQVGRLPIDFVIGEGITAVILTIFFLFMGWGLARLMDMLIDKVSVSAAETAIGVTLLIGIPFLAAQSTIIWQQAQMRPIVYQQLQEQIGQSLREGTLPDALLFGSAQIGFLAHRPTWLWQEDSSDNHYLPQLLTRFIQQPPDIFVSAHTLPWEQLIGTGWFQQRYRAADSFQSTYETRSPFTIWTYRQTAFDQSPAQTAQVQTENDLNLVAYQYSPRIIAANEAVYVTLYWETTRPITTTFRSVVRLISPWDQVAWAQRDLYSPRSIPPSWLEPSDWFAERFVLTTTAEIPMGGYELNLSLYDARSGEFINLYQGSDIHALDRVLLGPVAVPWRGEVGTAVIPPVTFGNHIQLIGYERSGDFQPNATLTIKLYWQALTPPPANYTVFVHLLDENGALVTNHDGVPALNTFPTHTWSPGFTIPDEHFLTLPSDLPLGRYQIKVGLYLPTTGERLTVVDANGNETEDKTFIVEVIE